MLLCGVEILFIRFKFYRFNERISRQSHTGQLNSNRLDKLYNIESHTTANTQTQLNNSSKQTISRHLKTHIVLSRLQLLFSAYTAKQFENLYQTRDIVIDDIMRSNAIAINTEWKEYQIFYEGS